MRKCFTEENARKYAESHPDYVFVKHNEEFNGEKGLKPWIAPDSRVLILGTFPSPDSKRAECYYGSITNKFWSEIQKVDPNMEIEKTSDGKYYSSKSAMDFCFKHHIAIYDAFSYACFRRSKKDNSRSPLDSDMRRAVFDSEEIGKILSSHPEIQFIILTSSKIQDTKYRKDYLESFGKKIKRVPSPSRRNARRLKKSFDEDWDKAIACIKNTIRS